MPSCFQMFPKGTNEAATLKSIDEALCNHLGCDIDPKWYVCDWFNTIGFIIATTNDCDLGSQKLRDKLTKWISESDWWNDDWAEGIGKRDGIFKILDYLEANYSSHGFYQPK